MTTVNVMQVFMKHGLLGPKRDRDTIDQEALNEKYSSLDANDPDKKILEYYLLNYQKISGFVDEGEASGIPKDKMSIYDIYRSTSFVEQETFQREFYSNAQQAAPLLSDADMAKWDNAQPIPLDLGYKARVGKARLDEMNEYGLGEIYNRQHGFENDLKRLRSWANSTISKF